MRLRLMLFVLFATLAAARAAEAQEEKRAELGLYYQGVVENGKVETNRLFLQGYDYFGDTRLGVWGFAYGEDRDDYISGVVGVYYDLFEFGDSSVFELGFAAGAEKFRDEGEKRAFGRYAGNLFIGSDDLHFEYYHEFGSSHSDWRRVELIWQATPAIALSGFHQTGDGTGSRVILSIPKTPLKIGPAVIFGEGGTKALLGGEIVFSQKR